MTFKNKTKYVTMFSVLVASVMVISISETHSAFADTPIDTTDYFGQALKIFNQQQKIKSEATSFQHQIDDLKTSNVANTDTINSRIVSLQAQLDADKTQIDDMTKELKRLETLNIKSYQVDPETAKKFSAAENAIRAKYLQSYSSDNPVQLVYANLKYRNIVVLLNSDLVKNGKATINGSIVELDAKSLQMMEPTQDIPVDIRYGKTQLASCTNVNLQCTPIEAGVSISATTATHTLNTLGYEATRSGSTGFVIARHTAQTNTIVQPYTSSNVIGTVTILGSDPCDCAFVAVNQASVNKIFGQESYTIQNKIPTSQQTVGTWVYKQGAATGLTFGQIVTNDPSYPYDLIASTGNVANGDSGSPVFAYNAQNGIDLYGMVSSMSTDGTNYWIHYIPWDYIQGNIGAIPAP